VRLMTEGLEGIQHIGHRSSVMSDVLRKRGEREVFNLPMSEGQASREGGGKLFDAGDRNLGNGSKESADPRRFPPCSAA